MEQRIRLLPDHLANQIAAGEVVQRPASVVKELLENAVDAGATEISLILRDAGKTLIQVQDNGSGMTAMDARMCFERHATSKIATTEDLFTIRTMGFRGEAMASIAAVAQVTLKTRPRSQELGTELLIEGSQYRNQQPVAMPPGTQVSVRNLFYNVPARRNFLKSNQIETKHILTEFSRVAVAHPAISFSFYHNDQEIYRLPATKVPFRLSTLLSDSLDGNLIHFEEATPYIRVHGWLGRPTLPASVRDCQFFFVNSRYIRNQYLHHAVKRAYEGMISEGDQPAYCIFMEIDPKHIDINIHPTKTEIKFDDEQNVYRLFHTVIRKALADYHLPFAPEGGDQNVLDFFTRPRGLPEQPRTIGDLFPRKQHTGTPAADDWRKLFQTPAVQQKESSANAQLLFQPEQTRPQAMAWQYRQRYIVLCEPESIRIIDQHRAHVRVLYDQFMRSWALPPVSSQQSLFPAAFELSHEAYLAMQELEPSLQHLGFDVKPFGPQTYILYGTPPEIKIKDPLEWFGPILEEYQRNGAAATVSLLQENISLSLAKRGAIPAGKYLTQTEMESLIAEWAACDFAGITPDGKQVCHTFDVYSLSQLFG